MSRAKWASTSIIFCVLAVLVVFSATAYAAGPIDLDREVSLEIVHLYDGKPIQGADFSIYKVADVDPNAYGGFIVDKAFDRYPVQFDDMDQDAWNALASTLKGYVLRDGLTPFDTGTTGTDGKLRFPNQATGMKPGLYLVLGEPTVDAGYVYSSLPYLVALPGFSETDNDWLYDVVSRSKCSRTEDLLDLTVLKKWDDKGFELVRPDSVTVQLLCDGKVQDTVVLNPSNNWTYTWTKLESRFDWTVVEQDIKNYQVIVEVSGDIVTITNKFVSPVLVDPPVSKVIEGEKPASTHTFSFVLSPLDSSYPMPEGTENGTKTINIAGAGVKEFGAIKFTEPGTYAYSISEKQEDVEGYTFDKTVYVVTYVVTEDNGELHVERTIKTNMGVVKDNIVFTNYYKKPGPKIPQTGLLLWPIPVMAGLGVMLIAAGLVKRKRTGNAK